MSDHLQPPVDEDEVSLKEAFSFFGNLFRSMGRAVSHWIQSLLIWTLSPFLKKRLILFTLAVVLVSFSASLVQKSLEKRSYETMVRMATSLDNQRVKELSDALYYPQTVKAMMKKAGVREDYVSFVEKIKNPYPYEVIGITNVLSNEIEKQIEIRTNIQMKVVREEIKKTSGIFFEPYPSPLHIREIHLKIKGLDRDLITRLIPPIEEAILNTANTSAYYFFFREMALNAADELKKMDAETYWLRSDIEKKQRLLSGLRKIKRDYGDVYRFDSVFGVKSLYVENMSFEGAEKILNLPMTALIANAERSVASNQSVLYYQSKMKVYQESLLKIARELNKNKKYDFKTVQEVIAKYTPKNIENSVSDFILSGIRYLKLKNDIAFLSESESPLPMPKHTLSFALQNTLKAFVLCLLLIWILKFLKQSYDWLKANQEK